MSYRVSVSELAANPYRAPGSSLLESREASDAELLAFAEPRGDYYLRAWRGFRAGRGSWSRPNLAAFCCGAFWCFYRRMYLLGAGMIALGGIGAYALKHALGAAPGTDLLVGVCLASVLSALGNRAYYEQALDAIDAARQRTDDPAAQLEAIRGAGGTHELWLSVPMYASLGLLALALLRLAWVALVER
jgi:hypothetical protein